MNDTLLLSHMIAVTNRRLCNGDFLKQVDRICRANPDRIILREKDLDAASYEALLCAVLPICEKYKIPLCVSGHIQLAAKYNTGLHLSYNDFMVFKAKSPMPSLKTVGVSVHSVIEAEHAAQNDAAYIIAGHIFATDCKKDIPPRGLDFLESVCSKVTQACTALLKPPIPVYAIGGITPQALPMIFSSGAFGGCMMSGAMKL